MKSFNDYINESYINEAEEKTYTIVKERKGRTTEIEGTLSYFIEYFGYTLEKGKSYEREKGNAKINTKPKDVKSLVVNLNNAVNNAARNGFADTFYSLKG